MSQLLSGNFRQFRTRHCEFCRGLIMTGPGMNASARAITGGSQVEGHSRLARSDAEIEDRPAAKCRAFQGIGIVTRERSMATIPDETAEVLSTRRGY